MICCDHCEEWFHGMCVGITMAQGRQMEKNGQEYVCPKCKGELQNYGIHARIGKDFCHAHMVHKATKWH